MKKISFTDVPIFQDLLVIKTDKLFLDLHSDFECVNIAAQKRLIFTFLSQKHQIDLIFSDYQIVSQAFSLEVAYAQTLDIFYRGRYQMEETLHDQYEERQCFYMDFIENQSLCVLAKKAYCIINKAKPTDVIGRKGRKAEVQPIYA